MRGPDREARKINEYEKAGKKKMIRGGGTCVSAWRKREKQKNKQSSSTNLCERRVGGRRAKKRAKKLEQRERGDEANQRGRWKLGVARNSPRRRGSKTNGEKKDGQGGWL